MSKTIDNLNQSLEQQLNLNELQDVIDNNLQTEAKSIVGAINEITGKQVISDTIGTPLVASDTWNDMETKINGLLSTFKTNMMSNGITVESGDKFKALIDKIATLADSEGKGIQFAEGTYTKTSNTLIGANIEVNTNLDFTPSHIFAVLSPFDFWLGSVKLENYVASNLFYTKAPSNEQYYNRAYVTTITPEYFIIESTDGSKNNHYINYGENLVINWYAIGVGEEDTTLRDSLASILENKGVDVTDEDDMASLIGKVDVALDNNISDYLMAASSQVSFRVGGTSWTEVSFNHSFGKVPKLVLIGVNSFGSLVSSMYHTNASNYATYTYSSSSKIYIYISSITSSKVTLNMKYSNASGSMSTSATFYYTMIY